VLPEDYAKFASQKTRFPVSRPDDVSYCPNAHLSKVPAVRTTYHTVRTPNYIPSIICPDDENFPSGPSPVSRSFELLQLASVWTFQQPVRTTLSVQPSFRISFQNIDIGRLLQPSGRRGFPSGRAHPKGKYHNSNQDIRALVSLVQTRVHQIWKLSASNQSSGRSSPWSGRAKPLYGNYLQWTCDCPDIRALPLGRGSKTGKNFSKILGQLIAQLSIQTAHDYHPDGA
jgi:hypothetical protein